MAPQVFGADAVDQGEQLNAAPRRPSAECVVDYGNGGTGFLGATSKPFEKCPWRQWMYTHSTVGAGLPALAMCQSSEGLAMRQSSQASQLPHSNRFALDRFARLSAAIPMNKGIRAGIQKLEGFLQPRLQDASLRQNFASKDTRNTGGTFSNAQHGPWHPD